MKFEVLMTDMMMPSQAFNHINTGCDFRSFCCLHYQGLISHVTQFDQYFSFIVSYFIQQILFVTSLWLLIALT